MKYQLWFAAIAFVVGTISVSVRGQESLAGDVTAQVAALQFSAQNASMLTLVDGAAVILPMDFFSAQSTNDLDGKVLGLIITYLPEDQSGSCVLGLRRYHRCRKEFGRVAAGKADQRGNRRKHSKYIGTRHPLLVRIATVAAA